MYSDCGVLLCVGMGYRIRGFVCCVCIVLLCYCCFSVNGKDKSQPRTDQEGPDWEQFIDLLFLQLRR